MGLSPSTFWQRPASDGAKTMLHHKNANNVAASTAARQVWGLAAAIEGEMTGSGEWTLVAVTEAEPTATLSGLREVIK